jgi:cell division septal protein FtsQ
VKPQREVKRYQTRPSYGTGYPRRRDRRDARPEWRRRLPRVRINMVKWAAIGVVLLIGLVMLSRATRLQEVRVSGTQLLDAGQVQRQAQQGIDKQWFGRNTLLLNGGGVVDFIKAGEPGIKQAVVKRRGWHAVEVVVVERQPSLNWKSSGTVYLLDVDGTVIGPSTERYAQLPVVNDSSNLPVKAGERVAPASFVTFCKEFIAGLSSAGLQAAEVTVPETTSEVQIKTNKGYILKLDTTRSAAGELGDLKAVLAELGKAKKSPAEYIDLRIEHKAYYK